MIRFDDALPTFVTTLGEQLSPEAILAGVVIRDVTGRLTFLTGAPLDDTTRAVLDRALARATAPYARAEGAVSLGVVPGRRSNLLDAPRTTRLTVGHLTARVLDRRISGADWLRNPRTALDDIPRIVFASMKGGVGRSTALAMCALDLTTAGRRVLIVDLDIEAPGLGVFLLPGELLPEFGTVDALVERKLGPLDDDVLQNLVQASPLGGGGLLVCPALGRRSMDHPENVLSKIGRIYHEVDATDGSALSVLDQVAELVDGLVQIHRPDVVLIDARAGLHELTAATILGLGSEVLLFGLDEPQTWHACRVLLHQLHAAFQGAPGAWADALTPVQGKAPVDIKKRRAFRAAWDKLLEEVTGVAPAVATPELTGPSTEYVWDEDETATVMLRDDGDTTVCVLSDANFAGFNPLGATRDSLTEAATRTTFGSLMDHVRALTGVE